MQVIQSIQKGNLVLELHGEINLTTVGRFTDSFSEAQSRTGLTSVILDMRDVSMIDSCGLGTLVSAQRVLQGQNGSIRLAGLKAGLMEMLKITKLDSRFECHPTVEGAVEAASAAKSSAE